MILRSWKGFHFKPNSLILLFIDPADASASYLPYIVFSGKVMKSPLPLLSAGVPKYL